MELKVEIDKPVITVGDFNILLSTTDRTTKQGYRKAQQHQNSTGSNWYNITLHETTKEYTFFQTPTVYIYILK